MESSSSPPSGGVVNNGSSSNNSTVNVNLLGMSFPYRSPLSLVLDYWTTRGGDSSSSAAAAEPVTMIPQPRTRPRFRSSGSAAAGGGGGDSDGEVAIRIGGGEQQEGSDSSSSAFRNRAGELNFHEVISGGRGGTLSEEARRAIANERVPLVSLADVVGGGTTGGGRERDSSSSSSNYPRLDFQLIAKWVEQILPFSLLLLVVLIRQHLQGICFSCVVLRSVLILPSNAPA